MVKIDLTEKLKEELMKRNLFEQDDEDEEDDEEDDDYDDDDDDNKEEESLNSNAFIRTEEHSKNFISYN